MKKELATIINGLIGKELSTVDKWIYRTAAQILIDVCDGFDDSMTMLSDRLSTKEIDDILEFFNSTGFTCKNKYAETSDRLPVVYTYWGEEEEEEED